MPNGSYRKRAYQAYKRICYWCDETLLCEIHHIDHNRSNNKVQNLMVLCTFCHKLETMGFVAVGEHREMIIVKFKRAVKAHFARLGVDPTKRKL